MGNTSSSSKRDVEELKKHSKPLGLYPKCDWDEKQIASRIVKRRLAPCYPGTEEKKTSLEECPICFLNYPLVNRSQCCKKAICTECYLQVKKPKASSYESKCPFCKAPGYEVYFKGPQSAEEKAKEEEEEQRVIALRLQAEKDEQEAEKKRAEKREQAKAAGTPNYDYYTEFMGSSPPPEVNPRGQTARQQLQSQLRPSPAAAAASAAMMRQTASNRYGPQPHPPISQPIRRVPRPSPPQDPLAPGRPLRQTPPQPSNLRDFVPKHLLDAYGLDVDMEEILMNEAIRRSLLEQKEQPPPPPSVGQPTSAPRAQTRPQQQRRDFNDGDSCAPLSVSAPPATRAIPTSTAPQHVRMQPAVGRGVIIGGDSWSDTFTANNTDAVTVHTGSWTDRTDPTSASGPATTHHSFGFNAGHRQHPGIPSDSMNSQTRSMSPGTGSDAASSAFTLASSRRPNTAAVSTTPLRTSLLLGTEDDELSRSNPRRRPNSDQLKLLRFGEVPGRLLNAEQAELALDSMGETSLEINNNESLDASERSDLFTFEEHSSVAGTAPASKRSSSNFHPTDGLRTEEGELASDGDESDSCSNFDAASPRVPQPSSSTRGPRGTQSHAPNNLDDEGFDTAELELALALSLSVSPSQQALSDQTSQTSLEITPSQTSPSQPIAAEAEALLVQPPVEEVREELEPPKVSLDPNNAPLVQLTLTTTEPEHVVDTAEERQLDLFEDKPISEPAQTSSESVEAD